MSPKFAVLVVVASALSAGVVGTTIAQVQTNASGKNHTNSKHHDVLRKVHVAGPGSGNG